ncbi:MAG: tRNA pseudouridine(55) synthase, partial [Cyclobacteriaceae bacterium]|nr:tRNA pseudouridine(55) synthase [Cyclobacteriaceae bacterium]
MNKYPAVEDGRMILINKELHWTSFDVVKKIRNLVRIKKVGHAGTLDPLATGLLIVCTGRMTKQINQFMNLEKEYTGTMVLGKTTPSVDLETEIDKETSIEHITEEDVINTAEKFTGNLMQTPPIYSALKKDGEPLYKKARKG